MSPPTTTTRRRTSSPPEPPQRTLSDQISKAYEGVPAETATTRQVPYLIALLFLTSLVGSIISLRLYHHSITSFRSRLPNSLTSSSIPSPLPYFADKRNLVNQYFVKYAWFWTTLAVLFYTTSLLLSPTPPASRSPSHLHTALRTLRRYVLATAFWWYLTQSTWFLGHGPSIAQRVLLFSGAECVPAAISSLTPSPDAAVRIQVPGVCLARNGEYWSGGHDISGHTFMMVHAILLLWEVVGPSLKAAFKPAEEGEGGWREETSLVKWSTRAAVGLVALWWWMLLMTAVYFHTPLEKVTGFAFGVAGWWFSSL